MMADKISLRALDDGNWMQAFTIEHGAGQGNYVADVDEILALAYVGRHRNALILTVYADEEMVGILLVEDAAREGGYYSLQELLIDRHHQGKGYASRALTLLLQRLSQEGKFNFIKVGVHPENAVAISVYQKAGFVLAADHKPQYPDDLVMVHPLTQPAASARGRRMAGETGGADKR